MDILKASELVKNNGY